MEREREREMERERESEMEREREIFSHILCIYVFRDGHSPSQYANNIDMSILRSYYITEYCITYYCIT